MRTPRKDTQCKKLLTEEIARLAQEAFSAYYKSIERPLFLYGRKYEGSVAIGFNELTVATSPPSAYHVPIITKAIPKDVSTAKLRSWFDEELKDVWLWTHCD